MPQKLWILIKRRRGEVVQHADDFVECSHGQPSAGERPSRHSFSNLTTTCGDTKNAAVTWACHARPASPGRLLSDSVARNGVSALEAACLAAKKTLRALRVSVAKVLRVSA